MLHLSLEGPGKFWYQNLPTGQKDTWEHLEAAFKSKYGTDLTAAEIQARSSEFSNFVWQQGQALEEFHATVMTKGTHLKKSDMEMQAQFIAYLPDQLAFFVRARDPGSLEAALASAKMGDCFGYKKGPQARWEASSEVTEMRTAIRDLMAAVQSLQSAQANFNK